METPPLGISKLARKVAFSVALGDFEDQIQLGAAIAGANPKREQRTENKKKDFFIRLRA
jgi:hypothetical protein